MLTIIRNILAVILGFFLGSVVNMAIISLGPFVIPLPRGADVSTMEGLQESMKLFTPANFLVPLLAHALGTLVGAFVAAKIAASHKRKFAIGVGVLFLLGGLAMVALVGGPTWFIAADLLLAYIPMALLGAYLAGASAPRIPSAVPSTAP
jgi:hypothetical protein